MKTARSHNLAVQEFKEVSYAGKKIALATKHAKDRALSHPFRRRLGAEVYLVEVDTDALGTFSGEVERVGSPEEVALKKAKLAIKRSGIPRGLGSEGSFGPSLGLPFANADHEILAFVDAELKIEVVEKIRSFDTNLGFIAAIPGENIEKFLEKVRFGSHGLVVRPNSSKEFKNLFKGVSQLKELNNAIEVCAKESLDGKAHIETDMRAHFNPTRMKVIRRLGYQLAKRLSTKCDHCHSPGWGFVATEPGLPCEWCNHPTSLVNREIFGCPRCSHSEARKRADGKEFAEPKYCTECNP